jgi:hypothetical protein
MTRIKGLPERISKIVHPKSPYIRPHARFAFHYQFWGALLHWRSNSLGWWTFRQDRLAEVDEQPFLREVVWSYQGEICRLH